MIRFRTKRLMDLEPGQKFTLDHRVYFLAPPGAEEYAETDKRFDYHKCVRIDGERAFTTWISGQEFVTVAEYREASND